MKRGEKADEQKKPTGIKKKIKENMDGASQKHTFYLGNFEVEKTQVTSPDGSLGAQGFKDDLCVGIRIRT